MLETCGRSWQKQSRYSRFSPHHARLERLANASMNDIFDAANMPIEEVQHYKEL